jgi:hypothetical protein
MILKGIVTSSARRVAFPAPIANVAEQQYLQGAAQGLGREHDAGVVRVYLPGRPSAVHEQARPDAQSRELTPSVTPVDASRVSVVGDRPWRDGVVDSLSRAGYTVESDYARSGVLIVGPLENEQALAEVSGAIEKLSSGSIVIICAMCLDEQLRSIKQRLEGLAKRIEFVDAPLSTLHVEGRRMVS